LYHQYFVILGTVLIFLHQKLSPNHPSGKRDPPPNHIPDVSTFEGILDVLSLCSVLELGNIFNLWAYSRETLKGMPQRHRLICARSRARALVSWIFFTYKLLDTRDHVIDGLLDFYWPYLAQQARTMVEYKKLARKQKITGRVSSSDADKDVNVRDLHNALLRCFKRNPALLEKYKQTKPSNSFAWKGSAFKVLEKSENSGQQCKELFTPISLITLTRIQVVHVDDGYTYDDLLVVDKFAVAVEVPPQN
jgi:hypothetical protein